jgi:adhesin transport system membrane fusion protein
LIIEARLATQDIGFVRAGQEATVRLTATDAMRFDNLTGEVVAVSPDTLTAEDGRPFYRVRIATKRDHFLRGAVRYDLFPGMEVSTSIHTGERTVMEYLLDPFLSARGEALRER